MKDRGHTSGPWVLRTAQALPGAWVRRFPRAALAMALVLGAALAPQWDAHAQGTVDLSSESGIVPEDSGGTPLVAVNGEFRLLMVTQMRFITHVVDALNTDDMADWNRYVQEGVANNPVLARFKQHFRILGSTGGDSLANPPLVAVDAIDNTNTTGTGVPIYWFMGEKVADNYPDLYDGSWDGNNPKDHNGNDYPGRDGVWTGTNSSGRRTNFPLGHRGNMTYGSPHWNGKELETGHGCCLGAHEQTGIYAMSPVFRVVQNTAATGAPAISGKAEVGSTLTALTSGIRDANGLSDPGFTYQWIRVDGETEEDLTEATEQTYELVAADVGKRLKVRVSFTDDTAHVETLTSAAFTIRAVEIDAPDNIEMEESETFEYRVRLATKPTGEVRVRPAVTGGDVSVDPTLLTFTASSWHGWQTVTITGIADEDKIIDTATISHSVEGADYASVTARTLTVRVLESPTATGQVRMREKETLDDGSALGRLEIAYNGTWGTICDDRVEESGNLAPTAACRMLDYEQGYMIENRNSASFNASDTPIWLDDLRCLAGSNHWGDGTPTSLEHCYHAGWGNNNCTHAEDLWIKCSGDAATDQEIVSDLPSLAIWDANGFEGDEGVQSTQMQFTVYMQPALTGDRTVTVDYQTSSFSGPTKHNGTLRNAAAAGHDYLSASGNITFAAGENAKTISVTVLNDNEEDTREIFAVMLSNLRDNKPNEVVAQMADPEGIGIIFNDDDDAALRASFRNVPQGHDGTAFTVEVAFEEAVAVKAEEFLAAIGVSGGEKNSIRQSNPADLRYWEIGIVPETPTSTVTVTIPATEDCTAENAVCTSDGRALAEAVETSIEGGLAIPVIAGVAQVPETLSASLGGAPTDEVAWQWLRDGEAVTGATGATYKLTDDDVGTQVSVRATRGEETTTSEATVAVWPAASNPPVGAAEEVVFSTVMTLEAAEGYKIDLAGFGRLSDGTFGEARSEKFQEDGTTHTLILFMVNSMGGFGLATTPMLADTDEIIAYWNQHRVTGLKEGKAPGGEQVLAGQTPQPSTEYERYLNGANDGVKVAVSVRREIPPPAVVTATLISGPGANATWDETETVEAELRFTGPVTLGGVEDPSPTLALTLDGVRREAGYTGGSGSTTLRFSHEVGAGDDGAKKARLVANGLSLDGATLTGPAGRNAGTSFEVAPYVSEVTLIEDASANAKWEAGEAVEARISFTEAISVEGGTPRIGLTVLLDGNTYDMHLRYVSGSGTDTLVFSEDRPEGNPTLTDVAVKASGLDANGASIASVASGIAADLWHEGTDTVTTPVVPPAAITASFTGLPEAHGGHAFTFQIEFSKALEESFSYQILRDALSVTNGSVASVSRVERTGAERNRVWQVSIEPDAEGDVVVTLPASPACDETGAMCTDEDERLEQAVSATISEGEATGEEEAFRVDLENAPAEHDGASAFTLGVRFSKEPAGFGYATLRDHTVKVGQGEETLVASHVRRLNRPHNDHWEVTITPSSKADIAVSVGPEASCEVEGAICTSEGEQLSNTASVTVLGPPSLAVADAEVEEAEGATLDFVVTLSRAASATVTVDYATSDGSGERPATAGEDYAGTSGTLTFEVGDTSKTVSVPVLDDSHDEGRETMLLTLSNPQGGNAYLKDAVATGTIKNSDQMPRAWAVRFGRTVGAQVIDAVTERVRGGGGNHVTVGGVSLAGGAAPEENDAYKPLGLPEWDERMQLDGEARTMTMRELVEQSAFHLSTGNAGAGAASFTAWGRFVASGFRGVEDDLTLDGNVTSGMLGADARWERLLAGVMLSQSSGEGGYQSPSDTGKVRSSLMGVYPYARLALSERVTLWGVVGAGAEI